MSDQVSSTQNDERRNPWYHWIVRGTVVVVLVVGAVGLPVQDRFGGLADHSRGGPMGVRSKRGVNGDSENRVFRAASGVQILRPRPLASRGDLRAVPPGRYGQRPRSAAAPAGCGQAEESHADD